MTTMIENDSPQDVLVLWDLDQTLLEPGGVDRQVWLDLCAELTGVMLESAEVTPGSTARGLLRTLLRRTGQSEDEAERLLPRALELERELLHERRDHLTERGHALPGAREAIDRFADIPHVTQSVLTGNQLETSRTKLDAFALSAGLDLSQGAFGTDTDYRPDLVVQAHRKARERRGHALPDENVLLIGDSLLDIAAARSHGARVVAVATGVTPIGVLQDAGPDLVIPDLLDLIPAMSSVPSLKGFV